MDTRIRVTESALLDVVMRALFGAIYIICFDSNIAMKTPIKISVYTMGKPVYRNTVCVC